MSALLIADDEQTFLDFMVRLLQKDHQLLIAKNWNEVLEKYEANLWRLNATILDVNMPGLSGDPFMMIDKLLKSNQTVPMIIISGQDIVLRHEFLKMGVFQYHGKPIDMVDLKLTIQSALDYNRALRKLENYEKVDRDLTRYYQRLLKIEISDLRDRVQTQDTNTRKSPVLIRCEPGSRPDMLARIVCEDIDGKLFYSKVCSESLKNIVPYNLQDGDTLYLEGIENLGQEECSFLLSLFESTELDGEMNGAQLPKFRLIASVGHDAAQAVADGSELAALLEHLSRIELRIEPLRLRQHEIREIVTLIFEHKKKRRLAYSDTISEELFELFTEYNWPLNFEELDVILECLLLTCQDRLILQKHLHQLDFSDIANSKYPTLDDMVDQHIRKALRLTLGNKSRAAKMLGITPKTLYSRIRN